MTNDMKWYCQVCLVKQEKRLKKKIQNVMSRLIYIQLYCYSPYIGPQLFDISHLARHLPVIIQVRFFVVVAPAVIGAATSRIIVG